MTAETGRKAIRDNRKILYHIPPRYEALRHYLSPHAPLRGTFFAVLKFILSVNVIIDDHKYLFFASTKKLAYGIRRRHGEQTANRHMNMLCAMGLFTKQGNQYRESEKLIQANKDFFAKHPEAEYAINVFAYKRYTPKELDRIEGRCKRLMAANVTAGNFSQAMLVLHGLEDISREVLPNNYPDAPKKKEDEYTDLLMVLDGIIANQGYATRQQVKDNLLFRDSEIDKLFKLFRADIMEVYNFKRPTKEQMERWGLKTLTYVYTEKEI